jgi:prophage antirepressor-like protein
MNIIKQFTKGSKTLEVYGTFKEPLFMAKQIGEMLGIKNIRANITTMKPDWVRVCEIYTSIGPRKATFVTESGLYKLIMKSYKKEAVAFQEWVCGEVLPSIRKTGSYNYDMNHTYSNRLTFKIENEDDLHTKVVSFIKKRFPNSLFIATLGENQDTKEKRIDAYNKGYLKGSPDIVINNLHKHYAGFAIEFKSPTGLGTLSSEQHKMMEQYKNNGFKTLISNDYDLIIEQLIEYFKDVRIKCMHCKCKFISSTSLKMHLKHFHRIEEPLL